MVSDLKKKALLAIVTSKALEIEISAPIEVCLADIPSSALIDMKTLVVF